MTRSPLFLRLLAALFFSAMLWPASQANDDKEEQQKNREDAINRVVGSHDYTLVVSAGRLYIKQQTVRAATRLLGEWGREEGLGLGWNKDAAAFQQAHAMLLQHAAAVTAKRFEINTWVDEAWSQYVSDNFNAEEADVVATHFQSDGGRLQRKLLDWYMGEIVLFNYTFSDRIDYRLHGSEAELVELQEAAHQRLPVEDIEFASKYPEAFNFVSRDPGLKYIKLLAIPLAGALIRHIDTVAKEIETDLMSRRREVQPYLDTFKSAR